jgi:hypothetical protein
VEWESVDDGEVEVVEVVETEEVGEATELATESESDSSKSDSSSSSEEDSNIVSISPFVKLNVAVSSSFNHRKSSPLSSLGSNNMLVFPSSRFPRWTVQNGRVVVEKSDARL